MLFQWYVVGVRSCLGSFCIATGNPISSRPKRGRERRWMASPSRFETLEDAYDFIDADRSNRVSRAELKVRRAWRQGSAVSEVSCAGESRIVKLARTENV